jgi:hypothetical protein
VLAVGGRALGGWRLVVEARLRSWAAGMRQEQAERKKLLQVVAPAPWKNEAGSSSLRSACLARLR